MTYSATRPDRGPNHNMVRIAYAPAGTARACIAPIFYRKGGRRRVRKCKGHVVWWCKRHKLAFCLAHRNACYCIADFPATAILRGAMNALKANAFLPQLVNREYIAMQEYGVKPTRLEQIE